jgi:sigma-B regulation protein RsbU (phosphoserine phosphatase)
MKEWGHWDRLLPFDATAHLYQASSYMPDDPLPPNSVPEPGTADAAHGAEEDRYRVLVEQAPFNLFEIGLDGNILWANQVALAFAGLSDAQAIVGLAYASIIGQSATEHVDRWLQEAFCGTTCHFEFAGDSANGRHYKASLAPIKDRQGQVIRLVCVMDDITERKQMECALTESEERFRTVADYTLDW